MILWVLRGHQKERGEDSKSTMDDKYCYNILEALSGA